MPKVVIEKDAPRRSMLTRLTGAMPRLEGWRLINAITVKADHVEVILKDSPYILRVYVDGAPKAIVEGNIKFAAHKWREYARELYAVGVMGDDIVTLCQSLKIKEEA